VSNGGGSQRLFCSDINSQAAPISLSMKFASGEFFIAGLFIGNHKL
jgi:hypothetical protein